MGFFEDLFGTSAGVASGGVLMGAGVGVTLLSGVIQDKNLKILPQLGGLALVGVGAYKVYTSVINPTSVITPGDANSFGMQMTHPGGNNFGIPDVVIVGAPFNFTVNIVNYTSEKKLTYVECTITNLNVLTPYHLPPQSKVLNAGQGVDAVFNYALPVLGEVGNQYGIEFSLWDKNPTITDVETANNPHRITTTGWLPFTTLF